MDLGTLTASLFVDTSGMGAAVGAVQMFEKQANQSVRNVQNNMKMLGNDLQNFGRNASMYLTAPLALAGGAAFKMSKDFEASMQDIVGLVGMSQQQVDAWSSQILDVAPKLGQSPKALADALYFVTSSGFKTAEAMEIVMQSAKAASAGLGDTKKIADLVTSAMNAYKDSNLQAVTVVDNLTAAVREGKGEAAQFATEMGEVIPIAARMGVSFDQIASGMSAMTLTGSTVEETATYMRQILVSLLDATPKAESALHQMGVSSAFLRKEIKDKGLLSALETLNNLTKEYGEEMMGKVFGNIRALTGVLSLMGDRLEENKMLFQVVLKSAGDMDTAFKVAADTINFKYNAALAQLQASTIQLGLSFKDMVIPIMDSFSAKLKAVTQWYMELSPTTKDLIIKTAAFVAVIGPLALGLGVLISTFVKLGAVLKSFSLFLSANPILLMIAAAASLVYIVNKVNSAFKATIDTGFNKYIEESTDALNNMVKSANDVQSAMGDLAQRFSTIDKMSAGQLTSFIDDVKSQIKQTEKLIKDLVKTYESLTPASKLRAEAKLYDQYAMAAKSRLQTGDYNMNPFGKGNKKYWQEEVLFNESRAESLRTYAQANEEAYSAVDKAQAALKVLNNYLKDAEAQNAIAEQKKQVSEYAIEIAEIGKNMRDAEAYIRKMGKAQKQIGDEYDVNKEIFKLYNKGLEDYLALLDNSDPRVQKLIQDLKKLNEVMSTPKKMDIITAFAVPSKTKMPKNPMMEWLKQSQEKINIPNKNLIGGALQKDLADIAMKNAMMSESFEYGGRVAQDYSDQISYLKNQLGMLWEEGYRPGQEMSDKSLQTMGDMYSARLKELQQISQLQTAYAALGMQIMQSLMMGGKSWEDYGQIVIDVVRQIITAKAAEAMAVAIADAIGDAAQTGSLSWLMIPIFVGAAVGAVNTALNQIPKLKEGGIVPQGYPNDTYPAMLTSGEMVTPPGKLPMDMGGREILLDGDLRFEIEDTKLVAILNKRNTRVRLT